MQGNCTKPVPSAEDLGIDGAQSPPLLPLLPDQCVLVVDSPVFDLGLGGRLLLEGVYIRVKDTPGVDNSNALITVGGDGAGLWMRGVTLQVCAWLVVVFVFVLPSSVVARSPLLGCLPGTVIVLHAIEEVFCRGTALRLAGVSGVDSV